MVISKILNQEALQRARIHPIAVLLASSVYNKGHGIKGKLKWVSVTRIKEALEKCFILAFKNVQPTNKRFCLALDVSGNFLNKILFFNNVLIFQFFIFYVLNYRKYELQY